MANKSKPLYKSFEFKGSKMPLPHKMTLSDTKEYIRDKFKVTDLKGIKFHKHIPAPRKLIASNVNTIYYPNEIHTKQDFEIARAKEIHNLTKRAFLSDKRNWY